MKRLATPLVGLYGEHDQVPAWTGALEEFLRQEGLEDVDVSELKQVGDEITIGGGASPLFRLRRLS